MKTWSVTGSILEVELTKFAYGFGRGMTEMESRMTLEVLI